MKNSLKGSICPLCQSNTLEVIQDTRSKRCICGRYCIYVGDIMMAEDFVYDDGYQVMVTQWHGSDYQIIIKKIGNGRQMILAEYVSKEPVLFISTQQIQDFLILL